VNAWARIGAIAGKEILQLRRDRLTFGMIVGVPVLQLTLFGYAINQDVRHLSAGVADLAGTQLSRSVVEDAVASQVVDVVEVAASPEALLERLRQGRISIGIVLPPDFDRLVAEGRVPPAQLLVEASDPATLGAARGLARMPVGVRGPLRPDRAVETFEVLPLYNPERRSAVQIVPGLVGVILTMTMVLFTAVAIVRERERGNLELLIATPVRPVELMAGKILPYVVIGLVQVALVLTVGASVFDVPIRGRLLDIAAASLVFVVASLTLGLLISTVARTQFQAFQLTFFTFLPQILLSGFMFPFDAMPQPARWIAEILPLTHFLRVIRGIVLRAASLPDVARDIWPLLVFATVFLTASVLRFRKRLD
jgi:ABC-2 type transport system permease protein